MSSNGHLHVADYVIFVAALVGAIAIGIYYAIDSRKKKTTSEYLVGSRTLHTVPVAMSLTASFISSILMLGFPAETYTQGIAFWWLSFGACVGAVLAVTTFVPVLYPLRLTSVNEYLKLRYHSNVVAIFGTLQSICSMILYTGVVYYAPATAIESVTGIPTWTSILVGNVIGIAYTSIGGFKAVIWTDVLQYVIMVSGLFVITIKAIITVGGIENVFEQCGQWERLEAFNFDPDPAVKYTFWTSTIGAAISFLIVYGTNQPSVQRYSALPSFKQAMISIFLVLPGNILMKSLAVMSGLSMFAFYAQIGCDPLKGKFLDNANQLIPHFMIDILNLPGIPGLLFAGLASASLSSASSAINGAAANAWHDIAKRIWPNLPEERNVLITKLLVVLFGVLSMALAFLVSLLGGTVTQVIFTFASALGGPSGGVFFLGIFCPFVNWKGAITGGVAGFILGLWIGFGSYSIETHKIVLPSPVYNCTSYLTNYRPGLLAAYLGTLQGNMSTAMYDINTSQSNMSTLMDDVLSTNRAGIDTAERGPLYKLYSVSYLWIGPYTMLASIIVGILVSLVTGRMKNEQIDRNLLHPLVKRFGNEPSDTDDKEKIDKQHATDAKIGYENYGLQTAETDDDNRPTSITRM